jgi:hypothetical protein
MTKNEAYKFVNVLEVFIISVINDKKDNSDVQDALFVSSCRKDLMEMLEKVIK